AGIVAIGRFTQEQPVADQRLQARERQRAFRPVDKLRRLLEPLFRQQNRPAGVNVRRRLVGERLHRLKGLRAECLAGALVEPLRRRGVDDTHGVGNRNLRLELLLDRHYLRELERGIALARVDGITDGAIAGAIAGPLARCTRLYFRPPLPPARAQADAELAQLRGPGESRGVGELRVRVDRVAHGVEQVVDRLEMLIAAVLLERLEHAVECEAALLHDAGDPLPGRGAAVVEDAARPGLDALRVARLEELLNLALLRFRLVVPEAAVPGDRAQERPRFTLVVAARALPFLVRRHAPIELALDGRDVDVGILLLRVADDGRLQRRTMGRDP